MKALRALVLALLSMAALQGCGVKLLYNNLDHVVPWYVDSYIDLTPEQRRYLKRRLQEHLYWHRTTQLDAYVATLEEAARDVQHGLDAERLEAIVDEVKAHRDVLVDEILPTAVVVFADSSDEQLLQFAVRLEEKNQEMLEDADDDPAKLRATWSKEIRRTLKDMVGRLTDEQKQLIEARSEEVVFAPEADVRYRRHWEGDFLRALAKRDDPVWFAGRAAYMVHNYEQWYTDEFRAVEKHDDDFYRTLVLSVDRLLTPEQRLRLSQWFLDLAQDLRELAADAEAPPVPACSLQGAFEELCAIQHRIQGLAGL